MYYVQWAFPWKIARNKISPRDQFSMEVWSYAEGLGHTMDQFSMEYVQVLL